MPRTNPSLLDLIRAILDLASRMPRAMSNTYATPLREVIAPLPIASFILYIRTVSNAYPALLGLVRTALGGACLFFSAVADANPSLFGAVGTSGIIAILAGCAVSEANAVIHRAVCAPLCMVLARFMLPFATATSARRLSPLLLGHMCVPPLLILLPRLHGMVIDALHLATNRCPGHAQKLMSGNRHATTGQ